MVADKKAASNDNADLVEESPEVAFHPLAGLQFEDLLGATKVSAGQGIKQPKVLFKHMAGFGKKMLGVLGSNTDHFLDDNDARFKDAAWSENTFYRSLRKTYAMFNESVNEWVEDADFDDINRVRAEFLIRILSESGAPTNTLLGNPAALRKAFETRGKSLVQGTKNLIDDVKNNHGMPQQVKKDSFILGEDIATTPGAVVFKGEMLELIQYKPAGNQVYKRPMLMIPPQINKYYVLDLLPEKSLIRYAVDSGLQLFCISWKNPGVEQGHWGISEYALAVNEAIEVMKSITKSDDVNLMGFCSGAMTASAAAAQQKALGDNSVHSMGLGVTILESERIDNEMGAFGSDGIMDSVKKRVTKKGILSAHELALSMLWLRPKDLIWGNVVNNYLMGSEPPKFDILYWNNDWTNMAAQLHSDYLDVYWDSTFSRPGGISVGGTPIDIKSLDFDVFAVGGVSDHITPWNACYRSAHLFSGNVEFYLSNSGHVQTLLNSPTKRNASYFRNDDYSKTPDEWLDTAEQVEGSWWPIWQEWIQERSGDKKKTPAKLGNAKYKAGVAAPGEYVMEKVQ